MLGAFPEQTNPKSLENEVLKIQEQKFFLMYSDLLPRPFKAVQKHITLKLCTLI